MDKNSKFALIRPGLLLKLIAIAGIVVLAAACGSAAAPTADSVVAAPATVPAQAAAPAVVPTQDSSSSSSSPLNPVGDAEACTVLSKDDVSKVSGAPVDSAVASGLGGVCTYISKNLNIVFTIVAHSGSTKSWNQNLVRLGDAAQLVPGVGDQAFYNTNTSDFLVLNKDAEYIFSVSDVNYQPLDPALVQSTEKALAEAMLSKLP
jgi:hypothetical protein